MKPFRPISNATGLAAGPPPPVRSARLVAAAKGLAAGLLAVSAASVSLLVAGVGPASASTVNGVATIANGHTDAPLSGGGSTQTFTVNLPAQAACDGDTASDGYHVWSYLVHRGASIQSLTFEEGSGPSQGYGLVESNGTYYGGVNTAIGTGQVVGVPTNFEWAPLVSQDGLLSQLLYQNDGTSGVWEAGLACANSSGALTDNWDTEVTFTASSTDPNGFTWTDVSGAPPLITSASSATFGVGASGSFTATAFGAPAPGFTESGALPSGVTFATSTDKLSGTPAAGTGGSYPITLTASNGVGTAATQQFTLAVASLSVSTSTTTPAYTAAGQSVPFSYLVTNTGGAALTGVSVSANLNSTSCPSSSLAVGASETCTGSYTTSGSDVSNGSVTDTATASATGPVSVTSAPSSATVEAESLTVRTSTTVGSYSAAGQSLPFSYLVTNTGEVALTGVSVTANLNSTSCPSSSLAVGASETCTGTYTTSSSDLSNGSVTDTATATATGPLADTSAASSATVEAENCVDPVFTSADQATATDGSSFSFTVDTCSATAPTIKASGLPKGLVLVNNDDNTATISGTPAPKQDGVFSVTLSAAVKDKPTATQTLTVTLLTTPVITSKPVEKATTGVAYTYNFTTAYGYPTPTITTSSTLPSGLTFVDHENGDATLSGTPTDTAGGTYSITITASNGIGTPATQTFTLTVDQPPVITSGDSLTVTPGQAITPFTVTATGYPTPALKATGLPKGLILTNNGNGTATISGTPSTKDSAGLDQVTITASSKAGTTTQPFTITVT